MASGMNRTQEIVLFYIMATAATNLVTAAVPNLNLAHGSSGALNSVQQASDSFNPGGGLGDTLFGALQAVLSVIQDLATGIFALPILLNNLGIPDPIIAFLMAPAGFVVATSAMNIFTK